MEENTRKAIVREHLAMSLNGLTGAISPSRRRKVSNPARLVLRVQSYLSGHHCQQHFLPRSLTRAVWEMNSISATVGKLLPRTSNAFCKRLRLVFCMNIHPSDTVKLDWQCQIFPADVTAPTVKGTRLPLFSCAGILANYTRCSENSQAVPTGFFRL